MSVRRRPNGSWLIDFATRDGGRVRKTVPGNLGRREAEALERRLRAEADAGTLGHGPEPTLAQLLSRYWTEHGQHLASFGSEAAYLERWSSTLGDGLPLSRITADAVARAVARWRAEPEIATGRRHPRLVSPSTINRRLSCLQRAMRRAERLWGWRVALIPWETLRLAEPQPRDRSVPHDARRAYLDALPPRSYFLTLLAFFTGLRRAPLLRLTHGDIRWSAGTISAVSKGRAGGKSTPIPITEPVVAVLQAMGRLPDVGPIFTVTRDQLRVDRIKARRAAGLPDFRLHDARHSFAQDLEDAGEGEAITPALHHSDRRLRDRYSHARAERIREAIERVYGTPAAHDRRKR